MFATDDFVRFVAPEAGGITPQKVMKAASTTDARVLIFILTTCHAVDCRSAFLIIDSKKRRTLTNSGEFEDMVRLSFLRSSVS